MDKLVKRVTVVQGSKEHRHATVVYENDDEADDEHEFASVSSAGKGGSSPAEGRTDHGAGSL